MSTMEEIEGLKKRIELFESVFNVMTKKVVGKERSERLKALRKRRYFKLDVVLQVAQFSLMNDAGFDKMCAALEKWRPIVDLRELGIDPDAQGDSEIYERGFEAGYDRGTQEARARMILNLLETYAEDELVQGEELKPLGIRRGEIQYAKEWLALDPQAKSEKDWLLPRDAKKDAEA